MTLSPHRSTLYRLIEAGQLARLALLAPLAERGLEAGDDALLLALEDPAGTTREEVLAFTGLPEARLDERLRALEARGLLLRLAVGAEMEPGVRLTQQGHKMREEITTHWSELETALRTDMGKPGRKALRHALKRVIALLAQNADQG